MKQMKTDNKEAEQFLAVCESLKGLIDGEVIRRASEESSYRDKYEDLLYELNGLINNSEALVEDYKSQGLTFNTIEAEGYHRAMLTVKEIIENVESHQD